MRDPDVAGACGRGWALPKSTDPSDQACLAHWLVNIPGAHPFWEHWYVAVIHLRDLPGLPPAHKQYPEAEFELIIAAINPETCPTPDPEGLGWPLLTPLDVVEQFHGLTDRDAVRVGEGAVLAMTQGRISPDQDFRRMWHELITGTVEHMLAGGHVEN